MGKWHSLGRSWAEIAEVMPGRTSEALTRRFSEATQVCVVSGHLEPAPHGH
jgi:hypothetical protein